MRKIRKITAILLVMAICGLLLGGCTTATTPTTATTKATPATSTTKTAETTAAKAVVPFADKFEFSILSTIWAPYDAQKTLVNDIMSMTNTKINMEWAPTQDFDTKVNTLLSSNSLPNVIMGVSNTLSLIDQGGIIPLDKYYDVKYSPNVMAILKPADYPFIRNVNDGHIYSLLYTFDFPPGRAWILRDDWLKNIGMKTPTTWDEWLAVWRAIRDKDANGDGDATNEIPIIGGAWTLASSFGIVAGEIASGVGGQFCTLPGGGYSLIYEHPNYKLYLETMAMLYKEKLLDQEFATRDYAKQVKAIDSNIGFSTFAWAEQAKLSTVVLRKTIPAAAVPCVAPPKGPKGDQFIFARTKVTGRGVVTISADKAGKTENIMRFFDWMYSDKGAMLMNYGVEGTHYTLVAGKPVLKAPFNESFVTARVNGLIFQPFPFYWLKDNYMQILLTGKKYEELDDVTKMFYDGLFLNDPYYATVPPTLVTNAYSQYSTDLIPRVKELEANAITGSITVDQFFSEYATLKGKGLQKIIDEAAAAWKKVNVAG